MTRHHCGFFYRLLALEHEELRKGIKVRAVLIPQEQLKTCFSKNNCLNIEKLSKANLFDSGVLEAGFEIEGGYVQASFDGLKIEKFERSSKTNCHVHEMKYRIVFLADLPSTDDKTYTIWVCMTCLLGFP